MDLEAYLAAHGALQQFAAGQYVFQQGDTDHNLYFVQSGFLKAVYVTEEGAEQIKSFIGEGMVIGSLNAAFTKGETTFGLKCVDPCTLISFRFDQLREQASDHPTLAGQVTDFLIELALKKEQREYEFLCLPAEERYRRLKARWPELFGKVPQQDIALYLGVTPVGLSRIKKRVEAAGEHWPVARKKT